MEQIAEFCRRVETESEERKADRQSRRSGSGSASKSNHSKKTAGADSFRRKRRRNGSSTSKRSAHSISSKTRSKQPATPASVVSKSLKRVDTGPDCSSDFTPCAKNTSEDRACALEPTSQQTKTLDHHITHQEAEVCEFRAADKGRGDIEPELAVLATPNSARVCVPSKVNSLDSDEEYSRLSRKLRELK